MASLLASCTKEEEVTPSAPLQSPTDNEQMTVLGEKLKNPYTVEHMLKAWQKSRPADRISSLEATHYYVRFLPEDADAMQLLIADSLPLYDHPLDYEIEEAGAYYHDPDIADEQITWQYTVIPVGQPLPAVKHEILADLYLPEEQESDVENAALRLAGYEEEMTDGSNSRKYRPKGKVEVWDTRLGYVPVQHVKVRARRWFTIKHAWTNDDGRFEIGHRFRKKATITLIFNNGKCQIRNVEVAWNRLHQMLYPARKKIGRFTRSSLENISIRIERSSDKLWVWSTINNAVEEYYKICPIYGISRPPGKLRIWAHRKYSRGRASAPMLSYVSGVRYLDRWLGVFMGLSGSTLARVANAMGNFLPDVTYPFNRDNVGLSSGVMQTMFHELGHTSHYSKVGGGFWSNYIAYIVRNNGYGERRNAGSGRIAVSEPWAEHVGRRFVNHYYGSGLFDEEDVDLDPLWIPWGMYHDFKDNSTDRNREFVSGFYDSQIHSTLTNEIDTPEKFKNKFIRNYSSSQSMNTKIEDLLFNLYNY